MKKLALILTLAASAVTLSGQTGPMTQTEYVKLLYAMQKDPGGKTVLVDLLRKRGIDFAVTDGIRSLTRSKGANDDELKRALEEAGRRHSNPAEAQLPPIKDIDSLLASATKNTLEAVDEMPDFVVKQQVQRSMAYAGTNNFRNIDSLVVAVSYRSSGEESYKLLAINGALQNDPKAKGSYKEAGGSSSTGEFVSVLATIFKPESKTKFNAVDTDLVRTRKTLIFEFEVEKDKARQLITAESSLSESAVTGMKGRLWIDRESGRVLRLESDATEIPAGFPIQKARRTIDYEWVSIDGQRYLLPSLSDVRLTMRERSQNFESRNLIRFKDYQKYGTDVRILDDDIKPDAEPVIKP